MLGCPARSILTRGVTRDYTEHSPYSLPPVPCRLGQICCFGQTCRIPRQEGKFAAKFGAAGNSGNSRNSDNGQNGGLAIHGFRDSGELTGVRRPEFVNLEDPWIAVVARQLLG